MAKKKNADPVAKAKEAIMKPKGSLGEETRHSIEDALARTVAARDAVKSQERLAKAADKEARQRGKELEAVLKAAKAETRAMAKSKKAAKRTQKAIKNTDDGFMRRNDAAPSSADRLIEN
jgi:hypothetical protein